MKQFKKISWLGFLLFVSSCLNSVEEKPNVLFIMCDDLNDWIFHPEDHPEVKTPHIDQLRKNGVSFSNAHVVTPVCARTASIGAI